MNGTNTSTSWTNLNEDGRRLNRIIKQMNTKQKKAGLDPSLRFAYIDRLVKLTALKVTIVETVLNVEGVLKTAKKQGLDPIIVK